MVSCKLGLFGCGWLLKSVVCAFLLCAAGLCVVVGKDYTPYLKYERQRELVVQWRGLLGLRRTEILGDKLKSFSYHF